MTDQPRFLPASAFSLDAFADIFTRSFEAYFYQGVVTAEHMARRVRLENIDLHRSLVMLVGDDPAGQAVLALRGEQAWCGGFGVIMAFRGRRLARPLAHALIEQARQSGARRFSLEALTRNERALKVYAGVGLSVQRDLLVLEWKRPEGAPAPACTEAVVPADPAGLLERFTALHPRPAAWQRDRASLLAATGLQGVAIERDGAPAAYALFAIRDGALRLADIGAERAEDVAALLGALQGRAEQITAVNEPADSPFIPAFTAAGFVESDRQHEMALDLGG